MASLSHYYGQAKHGMSGINPAEATQLAEDWLIAGAAGAAVGLIGATRGASGLDAKIGGMNIPLDGLFAIGLGVAGLSMKSKELKIASIAAGGAASARVFGGFFKKGIGAHGDIEDSTLQMGAGFGWGADAQHDQLVERAKYL